MSLAACLTVLIYECLWVLVQTCDSVPHVGTTRGGVCVTTLVSGCEFNGVSVALGDVSMCYDGVCI